MDLEKALDVDFQDILNDINSMWGVKGLILTCSNLVVTWKVRPWLDIISCCPLSFTLFFRRWLYFSLLQSFFSICAKKKKKKMTS